MFSASCDFFFFFVNPLSKMYMLFNEHTNGISTMKIVSTKRRVAYVKTKGINDISGSRSSIDVFLCNNVKVEAFLWICTLYINRTSTYRDIVDWKHPSFFLRRLLYVWAIEFECWAMHSDLILHWIRYSRCVFVYICLVYTFMSCQFWNSKLIRDLLPVSGSHNQNIESNLYVFYI